MEADFRQYYQVDLRDFWRPGRGKSGLTLRLLISLIHQLPIESRFMQKFVEGRYSRQEHMIADVIDALDQIAYYSSVNAAATIGDPKANKKVHNGRPKGRKRPGPVEPEKKKVFTKPAQAKAMLSQWTKKYQIIHTPGKGCGPQDGNCGCPKVLVDK